MPRLVLSSEVGQLHSSLLADLFACDEDGRILVDSPIVRCIVPIGGLQEQATLNWNQPFEQSGAESKVPAIAALLQTGQISQIANTVLGNLLSADASKAASESATLKLLDDLKGRTGITKLNSRQVFSGMPPIRLTATFQFRAWGSTAREVEAPIEQIKQWGYLKKLSTESRILGLGSAIGSLSVSDAVLAAFPSEIPSLMGMMYGGNNYSPLVIESIGDPLAVGRDEQGRVMVELQVELATLTAQDRDMRKAMLGMNKA